MSARLLDLATMLGLSSHNLADVFLDNSVYCRFKSNYFAHGFEITYETSTCVGDGCALIRSEGSVQLKHSNNFYLPRSQQV